MNMLWVPGSLLQGRDHRTGPQTKVIGLWSCGGWLFPAEMSEQARVGGTDAANLQDCWGPKRSQSQRPRGREDDCSPVATNR